MKKRFSEEQIHKVLKESESGVSILDICRKYGISGNTFYRWRSKYSGMELSDLKRMKALEKENGKLKKLFVEQAFELEAIKMLLAKKWRAGNRNEGRSCSSSQNLESENLVAS